MNRICLRWSPAFALLFCIGLGATVWGAEEEANKPAAIKAQTMCPVMGGKINKSLHVDVEGKRIYVCCAGCIGAIKKEPAKFIKKLEAAGVTIEATPTCTKCGEYKGAADCCKTNKTNCGKCGLHKGAPGCCKAVSKEAAQPKAKFGCRPSGGCSLK